MFAKFNDEITLVQVLVKNIKSMLEKECLWKRFGASILFIFRPHLYKCDSIMTIACVQKNNNVSCKKKIF
jgi:hypothetical protein